MSAARGRRTAIIGLLIVFLGAIALALAPAGAAGVRVAGVSLLWWYAAAAGPALAALVAVAALLRGRP